MWFTAFTYKCLELSIFMITGGEDRGRLAEDLLLIGGESSTIFERHGLFSQ